MSRRVVCRAARMSVRTSPAWRDTRPHGASAGDRSRRTDAGVGRRRDTDHEHKGPTGGTFDSMMISKRVSGGPGLVGRWKAKDRPPGTARHRGTGAFRHRWPDHRPSGRPGALRGEIGWQGLPGDRPNCQSWYDPGHPEDQPAFVRHDAQTRRHPIVKISFTVSADGKTLTLTGGAIGVVEKFAHVYDLHERSPKEPSSLHADQLTPKVLLTLPQTALYNQQSRHTCSLSVFDVSVESHRGRVT